MVFQSCVGCGEKIEIVVGAEVKGAILKGFDVFAQCIKCKTVNRLTRFFKSKADDKQVGELMEKIEVKEIPNRSNELVVPINGWEAEFDLGLQDIASCTAPPGY